MFTLPTNRQPRWPVVLSITANVVFVMTLASRQHPVPQLVPAKDTWQAQVLIETFSPTHIRPAPERTRQAQDQEQTSSAATTATQGTARWRALAAEGSQHEDLQIVARDSLAMLEANGVMIAFDLRKPRGSSLLYRRGSGLRLGAVPDDAVVRELTLLGQDDLPEVRREAELQIGSAPRIFALYPPSLYLGLKGLVIEALKARGTPIESVKSAEVRIQVTHGATFKVTLVS